jgi:hypothetical protein
VAIIERASRRTATLPRTPIGRGPLAQPAAQILALSKMDWNTDALYRSMPATISYAQVLAKIVKHETLAPVPYDYRLFM